MFIAVLLLAATSLAHALAAALLWQQNQALHQKLLSVVAKAGTAPARVVAEVVTPVPAKTEDQLLAERENLKIRKALWAR